MVQYREEGSVVRDKTGANNHRQTHIKKATLSLGADFDKLSKMRKDLNIEDVQF